MRVALLTSATLVNGVAVHCLHLARYLIGRGHQVLLLHRPQAWIADQPGLEPTERFATSFSRWPSELLRVGRVIKRFGPDVLHTHMSSAHAYGAIGRLIGPVPVAATAHVSHCQLHWALNDVVIATSQDIADYNRRVNRVAAKALRVIPNFVDFKRLRRPSAAERRAARDRLGLPDGAHVIGSVGHLSEYKRPSDLVRAFAQVTAVRPDAWLLLIGSLLGATDDVRRTVEQLRLTERVLLTGARNDAVELLAAMDVFAFASGREGGPLAILEAMARCLPVVATRAGMIPEFVLEGRTGLLADIGDVTRLGQHLVELAADGARRSELGLAGRAHVELNFTVEMLGPRIEAVLQEASAIRPRPPFGFVYKLLSV